MLCIMNSCFSVAFIRYVFSFDTGEERRQTLDFSVVAFLKSRVLRDARHLACRQHDAKAKEHIRPEGQQADVQQRRLQKRRQTQRHDLPHPLVEAIRVAARHAEKVQTADCDLRQ